MGQWKEMKANPPQFKIMLGGTAELQSPGSGGPPHPTLEDVVGSCYFNL